MRNDEIYQNQVDYLCRVKFEKSSVYPKTLARYEEKLSKF